MSNEPREKTKEEVVDEMLDHIHMLVNYWTYETSKQDLKERLEGLAFSILTMLDGCSGLPAFDLVPHPHPTDKEYHISNGEDWYPETVINDDIMLHDSFFKEK